MNNEFNPNWASAPGDTIVDILNTRSISYVDFAKRMEFSIEDIMDIIEGRTALTIAIARRLAVTLGASVEFWMTRDLQYRQGIAKATISDEQWVNQFPAEDMVKFKWIPPASTLAEKVAIFLNYFGVPNIRAWNTSYAGVMQQVAFRKSKTQESRPAAVAAWIRQGEIQAEDIVCRPWNIDGFKELVPKLRALTLEKDLSVFVPKLQEYCAQFGVAVVIARSPKGCPVTGATKFISKDKALLLLSFRYLREDTFWFSFFHEAGHLILHSVNKLFLEGVDVISTAEEEEANLFAENTLIPNEYKPELLSLKEDVRKIIRFANKVGVSRGIVVGQLRHFNIVPYDHLTDLVQRYSWED